MHAKLCLLFKYDFQSGIKRKRTTTLPSRHSSQCSFFCNIYYQRLHKIGHMDNPSSLNFIRQIHHIILKPITSQADSPGNITLRRDARLFTHQVHHVCLSAPGLCCLWPADLLQHHPEETSWMMLQRERGDRGHIMENRKRTSVGWLFFPPQSFVFLIWRDAC